MTAVYLPSAMLFQGKQELWMTRIRGQLVACPTTKRCILFAFQIRENWYTFRNHFTLLECFPGALSSATIEKGITILFLLFIAQFVKMLRSQNPLGICWIRGEIWIREHDSAMLPSCLTGKRKHPLFFPCLWVIFLHRMRRKRYQAKLIILLEISHLQF